MAAEVGTINAWSDTVNNGEAAASEELVRCLDDEGKQEKLVIARS